MAATLPVLLPDRSIPRPSSTTNLEWTPTKYLSAPQPPPTEEGKTPDNEPRQMLDGKLLKKTRPRRTVDYNGGMGRWALVRLVTGDLLFASHQSAMTDAETTT
jgi:polyadenylation factor subunit 2